MKLLILLFSMVALPTTNTQRPPCPLGPDATQEELKDAGHTLLYERKFYQSQDCLQRAMNAFFDERKNKISESLKRQKTVDAARKIAVFKTIQRQAGLRGLPTIPDANTTLPVSLSRGELPTSQQEHFQMELFKRQQAILSDIKNKANEPAPIEPLLYTNPNNKKNTGEPIVQEEWKPNATTMERLESLALEDQMSILSNMILQKNHETVQRYRRKVGDSNP